MQRKTIEIIIASVLLIGIIVFLGVKTGMFLTVTSGNPSGGNVYTTSNVYLTSSNAYSNTYKIQTSTQNTPLTCNTNGLQPTQSVNILIPWYEFNTVQLTNGPYYDCNGVQVYSTSNSWQQCDNFSMLAAVSSNITSGTESYEGINVPISGTCSPSTWSGSSLSCNLAFPYAVPNTCIGYNEQFTVTMPKIGYCLDSTQCSSGQTCDPSSNTCNIQTISVYRISDNQCVLVQIQSSQQLPTDFSTLAQCQASIIPPVQQNQTMQNTTQNQNVSSQNQSVQNQTIPPPGGGPVPIQQTNWLMIGIFGALLLIIIAIVIRYRRRR